jgi:hypothetical protein
LDIATIPSFQEEMMHRTQGWIRLRSAVIALGLMAFASAGTKADTISNLLEYSTAGAIDTSVGVTGPNVISYIPVTNAEISATSNMPLGSFQVAGVAGETTTYNNTPFSLTFAPSMIGGTALADASAVTVSGTLNGSIDGPYQSSVQVNFNPVANGSFQLAGASSTLSMLQNDEKLLVPSSAGGNTTLEGIITTTGNPFAPIPEPSTVALFVSAIGGLGLRRYVLVRRQRAQA